MIPPKKRIFPMKPVSIIGMGMGPEDLTAGHTRIIEKADILIGGSCGSSSIVPIPTYPLDAMDTNT